MAESSPAERPAGKGERLQKVMAAAGVASRRACEELIRAGRVQVNGVVVTELGVRVDPERDVIAVDGRILPPPSRREFTYFLMHKPKGVLTTMHDPHRRPTVADLLPPDVGRVYPVGRLDQDSSGLILFTNDGELAEKLLHPRYGVPKTYRATVQGHPSQEVVEQLRRGVVLEDGPTAPAEVTVLREGGERTVLRIVLREGRKRQVRRMMDAVGHPVLELVRIGFGPLRLRGLPPGAIRPLNRKEKALLLAYKK